MPWREVCYVEERTRFIAAILDEQESMTLLCEEYGVSRKTGYKWLRRFRNQGPAGLEERSHAPLAVPWAITQDQVQAIVGLRREHPSWGPKKLRSKLLARTPEQGWPALSTIGDLLRRAGLSRARKRRPRATPSAGPLRTPRAPNEVWGIDFKGWFRTGDGARCDPLTVTDGFSRFLLCSQVVSPPTFMGCRHQLERVFRDYGLPEVLRSDNGTPFASVAAGGLSKLSVWWVKLGISPERIEPGRPQQNGRHERMHGTLKAETARPPAANLRAQQERFDHFRSEFNQQRPHEALGQTVPALHYTASPRPYPSKLEDPCYPDDYALRRVRSNGEIKFRGELFFVSLALEGELIGLTPDQHGDHKLYFATQPIGVLNCSTGKLRPCTR
jgi:putative transposase